MTEQSLAVHLDTMMRATRHAISAVDGLSEEHFAADIFRQAAVSMFLVVIGEAAIKIGRQFPEFVIDHEDWPWDLIRGLRNRIVHSYDTLNLPTIWSTANSSLPDLLTRLEALGDMEPGS